MPPTPPPQSRPPVQAPKTWTTRELLGWMSGAFEAKGLDSPRRSAELLLAHVIGCERMRLYMEADRPANPEERQVLRDLVTRALKHEPVQYLIGEWSFYGVDLKVDSRVLIPRPATETLVEEALGFIKAELAAGRAIDRVLDVGTGSGAVAIALAKNLPDDAAGARIVASDRSSAAIEVAAANVERHGLGVRIELRDGDCYEVVGEGERFDLVISNPPYIPDEEWDKPEEEGGVGRNVKGHEPDEALRGGPDGMLVVRPLLERARDVLRPGGMIAVEVAASCAQAAARIAEDARATDVRVVKDLEGLERVVVGTAG